MYNTLVDLHTGPRVLDQMLSMRSENHQGILFDNLLIHGMGWGGDPENYLRFNADKDKWYDFSRQLPPRSEFLRLQPPGQSAQPHDLGTQCAGWHLSAPVRDPPPDE